ncbi:MAG: hypothetical protein H6739_04175 [Alphaproteobacteria bacterium]|nr:hypothetical protein [Alphaproteobacteria bacterium]
MAWLLVYNAVNFCYWPDRGRSRWWVRIGDRAVGQDDEALGVMAAFGAAMDAGEALWDGARLAAMTLDELAGILAPAPGAEPLPLMPERLVGIREMGRAFQEHGGALGLIEAACGSAIRLARLLARVSPSWEDARVLRGERVRFLKRAQLCAAMIHGRFAGRGPGAFGDVDKLTVFADYRLPQVLRAIGMMQLDPGLAARIERGEELVEGSVEEVEIRAVTVHAGERLRQALLPQMPGLTALQVDHLLWRTGVQLQDELPPFHRCRTTAY